MKFSTALDGVAVIAISAPALGNNATVTPLRFLHADPSGLRGRRKKKQASKQARKHASKRSMQAKTAPSERS